MERKYSFHEATRTRKKKRDGEGEEEYSKVTAVKQVI